MSTLNLPTTFLQDAWCRVRLDVIQAAVADTITELEELAQREEADAVQVGSVLPLPSARSAALRACSQELLVESGLPTASEPACDAAQQDADWVFVYDDALLRYRQAAVTSLRKTLG